MECKQEHRLINQATWIQVEHPSLEGAAGYQERWRSIREVSTGREKQPSLQGDV